MKYILSILTIVASFYLIRYRESVGDMFGEADWMRKVGGVHMIVVYVAAFFFFWALATITGTTNILFAPVLYLLPGVARPVDVTI